MMQEHARHAIWNQSQHPYKHTLADFGFTNPAMPGVSNLESAFNWIIAVLYPNTKPAVANPAALPLSGNTLNDYRVVQDDGDGKAASYRWEQREGEGSPSWHKVYDMDWGSDSIFSAYLDVTQDLYFWKRGRTDVDGSGNPITGLFAGQRVWGGTLTGQNLTFNANVADATGFVQTENTFRPTASGLDLGTSALKFQDLWLSNQAHVGTLLLGAGSITDSSGAISFDNENLTTTGNITGDILTASNKFITGTLTVDAGTIFDTTQQIDFVDCDLITTGIVQAGSNSLFGDVTIANGSITSLTATISFGSNNLSTTGTLIAGNSTLSRVDVDNLRLDVNTISVLNLNGNLNLAANGTGVVDIQSSATLLGFTATGVGTVNGQFNADNLRLDGNIISSTNLNGNIILTPNGSGAIETSSKILPSADATLDLGSLTNRFNKLFLSNAISDGTTEITQATLQSLRDVTAGALTGMSLFWDGSKWAASYPDTEISHASISGLTTGDAGHTQFAMLAGRSGGQTLQGGVLASENLVLESTAHATKGTVQTKDDFTSFTAPVFSGSWSGTSLGSSAKPFNDLFTKGELKGARLENFTFAGLPASSAQNVGRIAWTTDSKKVYVDNGTAWQVAGAGKYMNDESFDGVQLSKTVTVSASITDARTALWQLLDNANDFDRIYCTIKAISATQVQLVTNTALPAGSYRLIGME